MELMKGITLFNEDDHIIKENAVITLNGEGNFKFNGTAVKLLNLDDYSCCMVGHDSTRDKPEIATKIYFIPNNEKKKDGINFQFHRSKPGKDKTFSCKNVIHQHPTLKELILSKSQDIKKLKLVFDEKVNYYCHEITPQLNFRLVKEHFHIANEDSCVYSLYDSNEIVYYGETSNLKQTIKRHRDDNKIFDTVFYCPIKNQQNVRKHWERFYLEKFKNENGKLPKYNKLVPYEREIANKDLINFQERKEAVNETNVG